MDSIGPAESKQKTPQELAAKHISDAHRLLQSLRARVDRHPELDQAIHNLEMALAALTVKTGAML